MTCSVTIPYRCVFGILALLTLWIGSATAVRAGDPGLQSEAPGYPLQLAAADTVPHAAHPDSVPYRTDPALGRQLLKVPAAVLHTAIMPLKWSVIWVEEHDVIDRVSNFFVNDAGTAGFYPSFSIGGRTPFSAGVTYFNRDLFGRGHSLDLGTYYTNRKNYRLDINYQVPVRDSRSYEFGMKGGMRKNNDQDIYIGGNEADSDTEVDYAIEQYTLQAEFGYLLRPQLLARFRNGFKYTDITQVGQFTETGEPLRDVIDYDGFGLDRAILLSSGINATLDRRNGGVTKVSSGALSAATSSYDFKQTKLRVQSGMLLDAGLSYSRSVDDDQYEYVTYYGEWQQYIPLPGLPPDRRLALRTRLEKRYPFGQASVPFYERSVLGDADNLRGYDQDRFRNLGSLLLTLEYRYPIWDTWDAVVFTDQGQVFRHYEQINLERFHGAVGTGLRFMTASDFLFRVEVAFSKEGARSLLEFNMNF